VAASYPTCAFYLGCLWLCDRALDFFELSFEFTGRVAFSLAVILTYLGLLLSWHFPEVYHPKPKRYLIVVTSLITFFFSTLCLTSLVQESISFKSSGPIPKFGVLYPAYVFYMILLLVWMLWNFLRSRWMTPSGRDRMQVNYCLLGLAISFTGGYVSAFALPLFTDRASYYFLGSAWPLAWTAFMTYAICRHRLMDIGVAVRNILIRGTVGLGLAFGILIPFIAHSLVFKGTGHVLEQVIFIAGITVVFAFYLQRFEKAVAHFVDHRIFRGRYDHETALVRFGNDLMKTYGREDIATLAVRQIPIILQADGMAVYLSEQDGAGYRLAAASGSEATDRPEFLGVADTVVQRVADKHERLLREEVEYGLNPRGGGEALVQRFNEQRAVLMMPLVSQDRTVGMLFLGEKTNDNVYSSDDIQLLDALMSQVAFALDNARLYEQIVESQKLYGTILSHMQRGVLAVDAGMKVTTLNNTMAELFACDRDSVVGQRADEQFPVLAEMLFDTLKFRRNQKAKEVVIVREDREFPCECETSFMLDSHNQVSGAVIVCQDLTERKRFEEQMRRMDRLASVGTLAAGIAHEIKNPLVSIQTFAQLLPLRYEDAEFRDGFGGVVRNEIERINHLIRDLLNFASPMPREMGRVNVEELCERALTLLGNEIKQNSVTVIRDFDKKAKTVFGDNEQLYQVFLNVLQNAIQAMDGEQPHEIRITTRPSPKQDGLGGVREYLQIRFRDTGSGIDADHLGRIFDPFYSTRENGSGLGLSICHGILKNHGAEIDVQSTPGRGTVFTFFLPVSPRTETVAAKAEK
jgi:PAS domain S-box-containing protein